MSTEKTKREYTYKSSEKSALGISENGIIYTQKQNQKILKCDK